MASSNEHQDEDVVTNTIFDYSNRLKNAITSKNKLSDLGMVVFIILIVLLVFTPMIMSFTIVKDKVSSDLKFSMMIPSLIVVLILIFSYRTTEHQLEIEFDVACMSQENKELYSGNKLYITQFMILQYLKTYAKFIVYALVAYFFFMIMYVLLCAGDRGCSCDIPDGMDEIHLRQYKEECNRRYYFSLGKINQWYHLWKLPIWIVEHIGKFLFETCFCWLSKKKMYSIYKHFTPSDMFGFFNIFGKNKTPLFIHSTVFITGLIGCILIGILYVKPIRSKKDCMDETIESFKHDFMNGYFIIMTIIIFLYLAYSFTMMTKFI